MVQDHGFARVGTMQVQAIMPRLIYAPSTNTIRETSRSRHSQGGS